MRTTINKHHTIILLFISFGIGLVGCSTTKNMVDFNNLDYPASLSASLYDNEYNIITKGIDIDSLTYFEIKTTYWSFAYGLINLDPKINVSDTINSIIEHYNGDGIINLKVTFEDGIPNKIYSFLLYLPSWIPFLPSSADIKISGEIVSVIKYETINNFNLEDCDYVSKQNFDVLLKRLIYEEI